MSQIIRSPSSSSGPSSSSPIKNDSLKPRKRFTSPKEKTDKMGISPNKRLHLKNMSPNVTNKTIYINFTPKPEDKLIKRPTLNRPISNKRSKSSIISKKPTLTLSPSKLSLRRTNSFNDNALNNNNGNPTDRFIPSRHNSITGKLQINNNDPHPNASPQTHIKYQTSKIYQKHVAEACGLEMNSRILQFQPLPPDRKKPIDLFTANLSTNSNKSLRPSVAFARAKKIPTAPERVLDAPGLIDDFYLNLLAWSSTNLLAIGLQDTVYVWNASTGSVGLLCELPNKTLVTSLKWSDDGSYISVGKDDGFIEIWDIETNTKLRTLNCDNHLTRIASQAWNQHILTSGSRIGNLYHSDVRVPQHFNNKFENVHSAEICGIEYKPDGQQFATGGNDNLVCIWDVRQSVVNHQPLFTKHTHKAAVKALKYSPFQNNLLVTGGGSSDKTINFWNTSTGSRINSIETESQISSLNWGYSSGTGIEIVATHGMPNNNISLFNYQTLQKTGEIIQSHDSRILNGCLSPDSLTLATVAADENLKFWSIFDLPKSNKSIENLSTDDPNFSDDIKKMKKLMNLR
ncbi:APC/C activator protein Cdc20p [[Candida] jaroonii]|uniref:APC/C activator protein Cdc20p n=1 Tax=[Candida] jaroonii TaxID=467808 RepID=A0ACA9Y948_9ASCO|nr:APC/C activator protein Cdc20p [[Candida] jaroonii]